MTSSTPARMPNMNVFVDELKARRDATENPRHRAMLDLLIEHTYAEVRDHDIDRTMATLVEDTVYHYWGDQGYLKMFGFPHVADRDRVRSDYLGGMESGAFAMDRIDTEIGNFFINDDAIAWDGYLTLIVPGALAASGQVPLPDGSTADDEFLLRVRQVIVLPFRDGLMVGEDYYYDGNYTLEKFIPGA